MQDNHGLQNMVENCTDKLKDFETLKVSSTLLFAFIEDKILVVTPIEVYKLEYYHRNYQYRFRNLKKAVEEGEIKNIIDLIDYCKFRPGTNSQMYGLGLVVTKLERHI